MSIEKAIERSIAQNEIVTVAVSDRLEALEEIRGIVEGKVGWTDTNEGCDVWEEVGEGMAWRLSLVPDHSGIARQSIEGWADGDGFGRLKTGFVAWCWDMRQEILTQLVDGADEEIVSELVYNAFQKDRGLRLDEGKLKEELADILKTHRRDLVEALRESLEDD